MATADEYTDLVLAVFSRDYLLVFILWCQYRKRRGELGGG